MATLQSPSTDPPGRPRPAWRLVCQRELTDLWLGGRAIVLVILFSLLLAVMAFLLATNQEMSLMPPREMLFLTMQTTIGIGLFIGLLIGADSISGERERASLEALLLAPVSRRQIVAGKFLAAISPWPAALAVSAIFLAVLSPSSELFLQVLLLGGVLGTLLVVGYTAFAMVVSLWSSSNRTSLFVSLVVYLLFVIPTQFPGTAQTGFMGRLVKRINPIESVNQFLEKVIVNNRTFEEMWDWLAAPVILPLLTCALLFGFARSGLTLEGHPPKFLRFRWAQPAAAMLFCAALAQPVPPALAAGEADGQSGLSISVGTEYLEVKTGEEFDFTTTLRFDGEDELPVIILSMNIVNLEADGDPVDPEDWSPERSMVVEAPARGETSQQEWTIHPIFEGDYLIYIVAIPEVADEESTSRPIVTQGLHLSVVHEPHLNPGGVLPASLGVPGGLILALFAVLWLRRRSLRTQGT
ncbi:ABC transporter permease [Oricola cellulosilytica]|nr:ABC transporter permease subunit [Oricola cellulosilytica]